MVLLTLRALSILLPVLGVLSFVCLVVAMGTDYWYIIDASKLEHNSSVSMSSHTGLWRTCNFQNQCLPLENPFGASKNFTDSQRQLLHMQGTFIVLLPLSVIVMVVGGLLGFLGLLARAYRLLMITGVLLLLGSLSSLTGASVYVAYSSAALRELLRQLGGSTLELEALHIHLGWSLTLAWLSCATEMLTSTGFLLAYRSISRQREEHRL